MYNHCREKVHTRRLESEFCSNTNVIEYSIKNGNLYRGIFEHEFGYPTDIDKVWEMRDNNQKDICN